MTQQRSTSSPPQFRASLTNEGPRSVTVTYGADLLWSVDADYPDALRVLPINLVNENPTATPENRCWEYTEHPAIPIPAMATVTELPSGERIVQEFVVYNDAEGSCYPSGEYSIHDEIEIDGIQGPIDVEVFIEITESGDFAIEATPTTITG